MRLLELEIHDWRQFRGGPCTIRFDPRGTVLTGPNEAGKSTVFEAIRRALFDRANSSAGWVGRMTPRGSAGAMPSVSLRFEHAGRVWTIRKRFGARGETELLQESATGRTTEARAGDAEERLLVLLGAQEDRSRSGSQPESWGAFQWLFVPQDGRGLPRPGSEPTRHLGLQQAGVSDDFAQVRELVEAAYASHLTPTGRIARGSELQRIEDALAGLRETHQALLEKLRERDEARRRYDEVLEALPRALAEAEAARADWNRVQEEQVDLSGLRERARAAEADLLRKQDDLARADQAAAERRRRETEAADARAAEARLREAFAEARAACTRAEQDRADARRCTEEMRKAIDGGRRRADTLGRALQRIEADRRAKELEGKLARIRELDERIAATRARRLDPPPGDDLIERIDEMTTNARVARAAAERSALRVSVEGAPDAAVELDGAPISGTRGTAIDLVRVLPRGGGEIRVAGGTEEARHEIHRAADLEREAVRLMAPFGAEDLPALRRLRDAQRDLRQEMASLERERLAIDPRPAAEVMEDLERSRERIRTVDGRTSPEERQELAGWPAERLSAELERLDASLKRQEEEAGKSQQTCNELDPRVEQARAAARAAELTYEQAHTRAAQAETELDRHRDAHGSSEACERALAESRRAADSAASEAEELRDRIRRRESDERSRRDAARTRLERLQQRESDLRAESSHLERLLEGEAAAGIYSRIAETETRIASEEERRQRLAAEAEAVRLLREVMDRVRETVVRRVTAPIRKDLDERLAMATAGRYALTELDADLQPIRLVGGEDCPFEDGSEGLRELVGVLLRMSVAAHLAATEPQTLILDDPCVHVSAERVDRVVVQLRRLVDGGRVQVIVLTHRESDFAGLDARWIDMRALRNRPAQPDAGSAGNAQTAGAVRQHPDPAGPTQATRPAPEDPAEDTAYARLRRLLDERGSVASRDAQALLDADAAAVRPLLQRLVDEGLAEPEGERRGRRYRRKE